MKLRSNLPLQPISLIPGQTTQNKKSITLKGGKHVLEN